jgi:tetratricopeptide (TPR) repeat protein
MKRFTAFAATVAHITLAAGLTITSTVGFAQEAVRPEIGKPLQAAQELIRANKFKEALAKLGEADRVGGKSAQETYLIERMRGSAASGAGDNETAMRSFEAVLSSGKVGGGDALKIVEALTGMSARAGNHASTIKYATRYFRDGGTNPGVRTTMIQAYFQSGDYANAAKESLTDIQADEKAGRTPPEEKLQLLANSYLRQKNNAGYVSTIEKLLRYYPRKSLWADVISRLQKKPGFSDRLALDVFRLQLATENLTSTADYMEMAQLALQAGYPGEAKKVVDAGYASGALGKGAEAERQKRLKDLVEKSVTENAAKIASGNAEKEANAAKDGSDLVSLGYNLFTSGQKDKGLAMMEAGNKKGGMRRPDDGKLRLGIALIEAGQKAKGVQALRTVTGQDGAQDLANLWMLFSR